MRNEADTLIWIIVGALGAVLLGAILIPLRQATSASNLAFVFLIFTIIVAELGGRRAALVTALISAISLNFFLTQPYLTLAIHNREDIIAFFALILSSLIAAAFGKKREQWSEIAKQTTKKLDTLSSLVDKLKKEKPLEEILGGLQREFGLGGISVCDEEGVLAAVPAGISSSIPKTELSAVSLFPSEEKVHWYGEKGFRLPTGGGRIHLKTKQGSFTLDLWEGDPRGLDLETSQALSIAIFILVLDLASRK